MQVKIIYLSILLSLSFGCSNTAQDFECLWRGSDCEGSSSESDSEATQSSAGGTVEALTGIFQLGSVTAVAGGDNSGSDYCESIAVDGRGNFYCTGYTGGGLG